MNTKTKRNGAQETTLPALQCLTATADYFSILSVTLDYLTLPEVYEGLGSGTLKSDLEGIGGELGITDRRFGEALRKLEELRSAIENGEFTYAHLRQEYTRLFNDPKNPAIGFYEGTFINRKFQDAGKSAPDNSALFINQAALDADRQYKRAGVVRDIATENIPGDCMLTEMAFMQHLLQLKAEALLNGDRTRVEEVDGWLDEFKRLHLKVWMYDFFTLCFEVSTREYFRVIGLLGQVLADEILEDKGWVGKEVR